MTAVAEPRLSGGFTASVMLHGTLLVALFLLLPRTQPPPAPPLYRVDLVAAPAGVRREGATAAAPRVTPRLAPSAEHPTPSPPTRGLAKKPAPEQPIAGGGPTGGKGSDVANIVPVGLDFPYPWYTANIVGRLIAAWGDGAPGRDAVVRFTIKRDGSVDPESIQLVSGDYSDGRRALGAVEQVADAKLFGALPPGFREDILPVTIRFTPAMFK